MRNSIKFGTLLFAMGMGALANGQVDGQKAAVTTVNQQSEVSDPVKIEKKRKQLLLASYLDIKDALVKTDANKAKTAAMEFDKLCSGIEGEANVRMYTAARGIMNTQDVGLQRKHFEALSREMYNMAKENDFNEAPIYRQFCPMAFDNQGAYWLSAEKEINNPYFGDKMLHCGKLQGEL